MFINEFWDRLTGQILYTKISLLLGDDLNGRIYDDGLSLLIAHWENNTNDFVYVFGKFLFPQKLCGESFFFWNSADNHLSVFQFVGN